MVAMVTAPINSLHPYNVIQNGETYHDDDEVEALTITSLAQPQLITN